MWRGHPLRAAGLLTLCCVPVVGLSSTRAAEPAVPLVVVLGGAGGDAEAAAPLVEALRIQLVGRAEIDVAAGLEARSVPARIEAARRFLEASGAAVAVWIDYADAGDRRRAPAPLAVALYALERNRPQALVEVARLEPGEGRARARALALKVAELLEAPLVRHERRVQGAPAPDIVVAAAPAPPAWAGAVEVGGVVAAVDGTGVPGARAGLGVALGRAFELLAEGQVLSSQIGRLPVGRARLAEQGAAIGARGLVRHGRFAWGGGVAGGLRRSEVEGIGDDGREGRHVLIAPTSAVGLELRWELGAGLALRAGADAEINWAPRALTLADRTVFDALWWRPTFHLSLLLRGGGP